MGAHVDFEAVLARVLLPTYPTHEGLVSRVHELVSLEVALRLELLRAAILSANKWSFR